MDRDTLFLLGDCTLGIAMTVAAMDGVLPNVKDQVLRRRLQVQTVLSSKCTTIPRLLSLTVNSRSLPKLSTTLLKLLKQ